MLCRSDQGDMTGSYKEGCSGTLLKQDSFNGLIALCPFSSFLLFFLVSGPDWNARGTSGFVAMRTEAPLSDG